MRGIKKYSLALLGIVLFSGCEYFDDYDKIQKKQTPTFKLISISDDFDANKKEDAIYLYKYNDLGLIQKISYTYLSTLKTLFIYSYDYYKNGYLKSVKIDSNADGKDDSVYNYFYQNNKLSKIEYDYDNDKKADYIYSYSYNDLGYLSSYKIVAITPAITMFSSARSSLDKSKYLCTKDICLELLKLPKNAPQQLNPLPNISKAPKEGIDTLSSKDIEYIYTYNQDNRLKTIFLDYGIDGVIDSAYNYYYSNNKLAKIAYDYDANGIEDYLLKYEYKNDLLTTFSIDYTNDGIVDSRYLYSYYPNKTLKSLSIDIDNNSQIDSIYYYYYQNNLLKFIDIDIDNDKNIDRVIEYNYIK